MAPMASSGWIGTPSLRTTITSSGAAERPGHLERHRHAAPGEPHHHDVVSGEVGGRSRGR